MKGIIFCTILAIVGLMLFFGCTSTQEEQTGKLKVVASFYPLFDFAKNIGGDRIIVSSLIPSGVEPHEFEPSPSDIRLLETANVFIYNGAGLEPWIDNLLEGITNKNLISVNSSTQVQLVNSMDADIIGNDPHVWLDPILAKKQITQIKEALIKADPLGKEYYEQNTTNYLKKLDELDKNFRTVFASCKEKNILITHATLAYFCKEYGCNQIPVEGVNAEGEPTPAVLAAIIKQAQDQNIKVIFVEELYDKRVAETIANDIQGKVAIFNSIHGLTKEEEQNNENYLTLMQKNIEIIKNNLNCN